MDFFLVPIGLKVGAYHFLGFFLVPGKKWFFVGACGFLFGAHFFWILFWCSKNVSFKKFDDFLKISVIILILNTFASVYCCTYNSNMVQHTTVYILYSTYYTQYTRMDCCIQHGSLGCELKAHTFFLGQLKFIIFKIISTIGSNNNIKE